MAIIKSGATTDQLTVDPTSKAARVTLYDPAGRSLAAESKATYFAAGTFTPPATPTDMVTIFGSATRTVRVVAFIITTTNTAAGSQQFSLIKRTTANSGGTLVAATAVTADVADSAATATVGHYTANPSGLGAAAGTINIRRAASPAAVPASFAGVVRDAGVDMLDVGANTSLNKIAVLNGTGQGLCLNFGGAALVAGQTHAYQVVWTEE